MPLTFEQALRAGINRAVFVHQMESKAPRRKAMRTKGPSSGTLFAIRNRRVAIREAALRLVQIIITYTKTTTGETKKYRVAPYELKYRKLKIGWRKMLWAYDMDEQHIKSFALSTVRNVALTDRKFVPKWPVLITGYST